ncbi:PleD family two-component system response regulator [Spirosoma sp. KNUC1025]|uniref:response regulator n=1 Tax=Spirosoma sp. KNUC1025 TaxID=2894082 RepID=UPI00386D9B5E|nr:response regulator [Spirosoma sp. KNUC1025]
MSDFSIPLIYVVDDDPDEHLLLRIVFARQFRQIRLKFLSSGNELFTRLTHELDGQLPDLILLDLHMPIHNGYEILQLLKNNKDWQSIPVAVRTAFAGSTSIHRCDTLGSDIVLDKGYSHQRLTNWIQNRLKNPVSQEG